MIPDPEEYTQDPDYYFTGEILKRQKIVLSVGVNVIEYIAKVFRSRKTGSRVHADFPPGYDTDIRYPELFMTPLPALKSAQIDASLVSTV